MRSQISVACLQSERVLRRRQLSCTEAGALCWLVGVVMVVVRAGVPVLQEKGQCRHAKGPTVERGDVQQQFLLQCPGSRA